MITLVLELCYGLFTDSFSWTGTGNGRNGLLYVSIKFSHYSGNGTRTNGLPCHFDTFLGPLKVHCIVIAMCPFPGSSPNSLPV